LESIKMGLVKPNSVMLATICVTWAGECVRAFFAYGISALTGRCSMAEATIGPVFNLVLTPLRVSRVKKCTAGPVCRPDEVWSETPYRGSPRPRGRAAPGETDRNEVRIVTPAT